MGLGEKAKAAAKATEGKLEEAYGRSKDDPEAVAEGEDKQVEAAELEGKGEQATKDIKNTSD